MCAILSVVADEDNDGNGTSSNNKTETRGRLLIKGSTNGTANTSVHPQDLRVKQIREILSYPRDLIVEWLQFQNVERPSQLEQSMVDELIKTMCLAWASDKIDHPNHAQNSYLKHVTGMVAQGYQELEAIKQWMQHIQSATLSQADYAP